MVVKEKSRQILEKFNSDSEFITSDYDTLIDLNYDGVKDFVIGYYGQSGSGIKNKVQVYLFDFNEQDLIYDEKLSDLSNPTFYIDKKKITEFYIGNGGGSGAQFEWINNTWTITKTFEIENNETNDVWKINYPLIPKTEYLTKPYQYIPPKEVVETRVQK